MTRLGVLLLVLPGWLLPVMYFTYDYIEHPTDFFAHFLSPEPVGIVLHIFVALAPLASTALGYLAVERMRLMEQLADLGARYKDYYDNAPHGYHSVDRDMVIQEVNATWLEMFGYSREEVVGRMKVMDMMLEGGDARLLLSGLVEHGKLQDVELVFRRKDGTLLPVLLSATAAYGSGGEFLHSRTMVMDNSDRKRYQNEIERVAGMWKTTFNSMPWGVMLIDEECRVLMQNQYFIEHSELSPSAIAEGSCRTMIEKMKIRAASLGSGFSTMVDEYREPALDRHFRVYLTPVHTDNISESYVVSMVDVTDIRRGTRKLVESRNAFFNMLKDVSGAYHELDEVHNGLLLVLANAIDAKSPWTQGHSDRVSRYAMSLADALGLPQREQAKLRTAALLHDIGKIGMVDSLLNKPYKLTAEEYDVMKLHPEKSASILSPIARLGEIIDIVRYHHEHYDGTGYPCGLKAAGIPLMSRVLCIADSFDSMTADRPYRSSLGREYAIKELRECSGTHFDPALAEVFIKLIEEEVI